MEGSHGSRYKGLRESSAKGARRAAAQDGGDCSVRPVVGGAANRCGAIDAGVAKTCCSRVAARGVSNAAAPGGTERTPS